MRRSLIVAVFALAAAALPSSFVFAADPGECVPQRSPVSDFSDAGFVRNGGPLGVSARLSGVDSYVYPFGGSTSTYVELSLNGEDNFARLGFNRFSNNTWAYFAYYRHSATSTNIVTYFPTLTPHTSSHFEVVVNGATTYFSIDHTVRWTQTTKFSSPTQANIKTRTANVASQIPGTALVPESITEGKARIGASSWGDFDGEPIILPDPSTITGGYVQAVPVVIADPANGQNYKIWDSLCASDVQ